MQTRRIATIVTVVVALTLVLAASVTAKDPGSQGGLGAQDALGSAFTYQGQLNQDGTPVTGMCDFQFSLWKAASGGAQIGTPQSVNNISVHDGLFTVQLDFGNGAFQGDARWLQVAVRCPAGSGSYTTLDPRQPLTPTPYALALPGLWTRQNATSPNLIGGFSGNSVTSGVVGATIGGGGESGYTNRVTDDHGTVGGGRNNQAGDNAGTTSDKAWATVGGGAGNAATGMYATVGGGQLNTASGYLMATVGGGGDNTASGGYATVGGGQSNTASGGYATVGGGHLNTASGYLMATVGGGEGNAATSSRATVGGGQSNTASGGYATVGGGEDNDATGSCATVGGGWDNTASGFYATVGGGEQINVSGLASTVAGGSWITVTQDYVAVGGGYNNSVSGGYATISGGRDNTVSGYAATVPGGDGNTAQGGHSFAAGRRAQANHDGAFVWADSTDAPFASTANNQFLIRASGGVGIGTDSPWARLHVRGPDTSGATTALRVENSVGSKALGVYDDGTVSIGALDGSTTTHLCQRWYASPWGGETKFAACSSAAEYVPTVDSSFGYPEAGDLVSVLPTVKSPYNDQHAPFVVTKAASPYDPNLIGFLTDPELGADGQKLNDHYLPLAIYGYFPVKVTMENGPIRRGDPITSSSKPGYGMKATKPGRIIGYALENADEEGVIQAVVQPGDYLGDAPARIEKLETEVHALRHDLGEKTQEMEELRARLVALEGAVGVNDAPALPSTFGLPTGWLFVGGLCVAGLMLGQRWHAGGR